ncbi:MAG: gliding motility-associated C-terminal domain-containing protein [Bacteroidia bacterium]
MSKKKNYIILFVLFSYRILAQNSFVTNYSFEDTLDCPTGLGQLYKSIAWINPSVSVNSTSDYFNSCNTNFLSTPTNAFGYQNAKTGNAYAGFYAYNRGFPNAYEYIETMLSNSLKKDSVYCVSFYLSLAEISGYCTNNIGVYFSNNLVTTSSEIILVTPQLVNTTTILSNKDEWMKVEWQYTALGEEKYITIGNFNSTGTSDTLYVGGSFPEGSYYYIDDVFVGKCKDSTASYTTNTMLLPNAFSPNNDGHNDVFVLHGFKNKVTEFSIIIYNRWGEKVFESTDAAKAWDGTYNGKPLKAGVFVYYINATFTSGEKILKKGNVSLIK